MSNDNESEEETNDEGQVQEPTMEDADNVVHDADATAINAPELPRYPKRGRKRPTILEEQSQR